MAVKIAPAINKRAINENAKMRFVGNEILNDILGS